MFKVTTQIDDAHPTLRVEGVLRDDNVPHLVRACGLVARDGQLVIDLSGVTFMDGHGILIIGEDTGSGHQNDIIWAYDIHDGSLTRIQTTPSPIRFTPFNTCP